MKIAIALLLALPAMAEQVKTPEELARIRRANTVDETTWARPALSLTPRFGLAFGDLSLGAAAALELSYAPPILGRQLAFSVEAAWMHPGSPNAPNRYTLAVDELSPAALVSFHWFPDSFPIAPYAGAGVGLAAMRVTATFFNASTRTEKELRFAPVGVAGLQLRGAGPGNIEAELRYQPWTSQTHVLNGSGVAPFALTAGYRFPL